MLKFNPLQLTTICFKYINTNTIHDLQQKYDLFNQLADYSILVKMCGCQMDSQIKILCDNCDKCLERTNYCKFLCLCNNCERANSINFSNCPISEHNDFFEIKIKINCANNNCISYPYPHIVILQNSTNAHKKKYFEKKTTKQITFFHIDNSKINYPGQTSFFHIIQKINKTQIELSVIIWKYKMELSSANEILNLLFFND